MAVYRPSSGLDYSLGHSSSISVDKLLGNTGQPQTNSSVHSHRPDLYVELPHEKREIPEAFSMDEDHKDPWHEVLNWRAILFEVFKGKIG